MVDTDKKKLRRVVYKRASAPTIPSSMPSYTWIELGKVEQAFTRLYTELDSRLKVIEDRLGIR